MLLRLFSSSCKLHFCGLPENDDDDGDPTRAVYIGSLVLKAEKILCVVCADEAISPCLDVENLILEQYTTGVVYLRQRNEEDPTRYLALSFKVEAEAEAFAEYLAAQKGYSPPPEIAPFAPVDERNVGECIELLKDAKEVLGGGVPAAAASAGTVVACVAKCLQTDFLQSLWQAEATADADGCAKFSELLVRIINIAGRTTTMSLSSAANSATYLAYYFVLEEGGGVAAPPAGRCDCLPPHRGPDPRDDNDLAAQFIYDDDFDHGTCCARLLLRNDISLEGADPLAVLLSDTHLDGCLRVLESSPLGHRRGDFHTYWHSTIRFQGDALLDQHVRSSRKRELIRVASILSARIMYLRDVVLPRFLEDHVIQLATVVSNALHTFIWSTLKSDGLDKILSLLLHDPSSALLVMEFVLSFQRNLKSLSLPELKELFSPLADTELLLALWRRCTGESRAEGLVAGELLYFTAAILTDDLLNLILSDDALVDEIFKSMSSLPVLLRQDLTTVTYVTDVVKILLRDRPMFLDLAYSQGRLDALTQLILDPTPDGGTHAICVKSILLNLLREAVLANPARSCAANLLKNCFTSQMTRIALRLYNNRATVGGVHASTFLSQVVKFIRNVDFGGTGVSSPDAGDALEALLKQLHVLSLTSAGGAIEASILGLMKAVSFRAAKCRQTARMVKNLVHRNHQLVDNLHARLTASRNLPLFQDWIRITTGDSDSPISVASAGYARSPINKRQRTDGPPGPVKRVRSSIDDTIVSMLGGPIASENELAGGLGAAAVSSGANETLEINSVPLPKAASPSATTMRIKLL